MTWVCFSGDGVCILFVEMVCFLTVCCYRFVVECDGSVLFMLCSCFVL